MKAPEDRGLFLLEERAMATLTGDTTNAARSTRLRGLRCRACGALQPADERNVSGE
jgi:hypothetical protein